MHRIIIIIFLSAICTSSSCRKDSSDCHHNIYFKNNSEKTIYFKASYNYPDTQIVDPKPYMGSELNRLLPNENGSPLNHSSCYEQEFKNRIESDTLIIFVFDSQVLESTSWETVKQDYLILKRYDLSLQDLQNMNFKLTYP